jgi:hypothetical protein
VLLLGGGGVGGGHPCTQTMSNRGPGVPAGQFPDGLFGPV